ncbi:MAG: DUF1622 domain-containing protein [bacterium]|nr:DUF1622 domain-containing protein [bacterium]
MLFEAAAALLAVTNVLSFFLSAWGALFILWGAAKAARRMFWTEAEPWKGSQISRLEEVRASFGHRILLGLEFFLAGDIIRLLIDPSFNDLIRIGIIVVIRVVLSFVITREVRLPTVDLRSASRRPRVS